jgi:hypothetical protein
MPSRAHDHAGHAHDATPPPLEHLLHIDLAINSFISGDSVLVFLASSARDPAFLGNGGFLQGELFPYPPSVRFYS